MSNDNVRGKLEKAWSIAHTKRRRWTIDSVDGFVPPDDFGDIADSIQEVLALLDEEERIEGWAFVHELNDPDDPYIHVYRSETHPHITDRVAVEIGLKVVPVVIHRPEGAESDGI